MRAKTSLFTVNGKPILAPDTEVAVTYTDIDSADSGRDAAGVMHRYPVRYKVASWEFRYSSLTDAERQYMESLFPGSATFTFGHPGRVDGKATESKCYRSKYTICWKNAATGLWSNYGFTVVQC